MGTNEKSILPGSNLLCYLENHGNYGTIHKFNDQEVKFNEQDDCYHVLAQSDRQTSSSSTYFSVMAKIEQQNRPVKIFDYTNPYNRLEYGGFLYFVNKERVILKIPEIGRFKVQTEGLRIEISENFKGHLSGMCGNSNLVMKGSELKGIKTCTFTKPS